MNPRELPLFPLASWELPPDSTEPLIAPATKRWGGTLFGRRANWLVRVVPLPRRSGTGEIAVRPASSTEEGNWWFFRPLSLSHAPEVLDALLAEHLSGAYSLMPQRRVYLREGDRDWMFRLRGAPTSSVGLAGEGALPFVVNWRFNFATTPATQVHDEVLRAWNDENSDLSFTRRWLLLSQDEHYALMLRWDRGSEAEFLRLMRLVLLALGPQLSSKPLLWWFHPIQRLFALSEVDGIALSDPEEPLACEWGQALLGVYAPAWNTELAQSRVCTSDLQNFSARLRALVPPPSAHEQLEAALELRDWLDEREARGELDAPTLARLRETLR